VNVLSIPLALAAVLTAQAALAQPFPNQCPGSNEIKDPDPFVWTHVDDEFYPHYVGTMEIAEASLEIGGETITTRVYRQEGGCDGIPAPTITMEPGNTYVLKFRNRLPYEPASEAHNVLKDPNVSNLHTHGLHISGEKPGDDVTRSFEGGAGGDFVYDIPSDHMGGTYWYHAHHHGSTFLQVSAGAFGLLLIDDQRDNIPATVAAMEERQLVVAYLDPDVAGAGGDTLITGTLSPTWTVNGRVNGNLTVPPNTWVHWRVLLADRDARMKTLTIDGACDVALMARDGVWRREVPKLLTTKSIDLTGASRADLAVNCSGSGSIKVGSTTVASVSVAGTADDYPSPYNEAGITWPSQRPGYLQDLRVGDPDHSDTISMGARTINGSKWDHATPTFTLNTAGVQEFKLKGATNHPFHLHVYHVQVQGDCGAFEDGEYYDVVLHDTVRPDARDLLLRPHRHALPHPRARRSGRDGLGRRDAGRRPAATGVSGRPRLHPLHRSRRAARRAAGSAQRADRHGRVQQPDRPRLGGQFRRRVVLQDRTIAEWRELHAPRHRGRRRDSLLRHGAQPHYDLLLSRPRDPRQR
jgi:FtsP/CotA-like multicopper oxidase with cupredoxin domain